MKKEEFILFDRDGVINVEKHYLFEIEKLEYEKTVIDSLKKLTNLGYKFIIITNQSGIAAEYYTEEDFFKFQNYLEKDLLQKGIKIEKTYYCPHHPNAKNKYKLDCNCRKPKTGNFEKAIKDFNIDIENSYMIGDRVTDLIPAKKLGIQTVLVKTGYGKEQVNLLKENNLESSIVIDYLEDFVNFIKE